MRTIIKREFKNYMKNPLLWIALLVIVAGIYQSIGPYLKLQRPQGQIQQDISNLNLDEISDKDVMDGFIPATEEQQIKYGLEAVRQILVENFETSEEEAAAFIAEIQETYTDIPSVVEAIKETYDFSGWDSYFETYEYVPGTSDEVNSYIDDKLEKHPFSWYMAMKFGDFAGLFMGFTCAVLLVFLYMRDMKRDTYELLHTKPLSSWSYILGKAGGGFAVILFMLAVLNVIFGGLCLFYGKRAGLPVNLLDFPRVTLIYILPNMLMVVSIYTAIALLFKNPLPGVPLILLYMIYSNMGSTGPDGKFGYYGRALAIMVRFPGRLFEASPPPMWQMNQIFLIVASVVLLALSANMWKRRRYY